MRFAPAPGRGVARWSMPDTSGRAQEMGVHTGLITYVGWSVRQALRVPTAGASIKGGYTVVVAVESVGMEGPARALIGPVARWRVMYGAADGG